MSLLPPKVKTARIANLTPAHQTVNNLLTSTGQTVAQIAAAAGITQDDAEKKLSILIDEGLAIRTVGGRTTATYKAA